jgi:antitoxin YefM
MKALTLGGGWTTVQPNAPSRAYRAASRFEPATIGLSACPRLKAEMDDVCTDHSPTIITRQSGEAVVTLSLADFNSIEETLYLLSSPKNAGRLLTSLEQLKAGKVRIRELDRNAESKIKQQKPG